MHQDDIVPGQRWVSNMEPQLGLGTLIAVEHRSLTVCFLATGETRTYARHGAPLTRVAFDVGDRLRSHEGWELTVTAVTREAGLLFYRGLREDGAEAVLPEGALDNFLQLNRPADRLFAGHIDAGKWFDLRDRTHRLVDRLARSPLRGLTGARTLLLPHQLYIAHEVATRHAPRVLLADEVGLGKTIEAGLILHQQLLTGQARRALIVVPDSLQHQWLVEMLRRFNLQFSLFDEARCQALEAEDPPANPFHSEQLVLCSLEFLVDHPHRHAQALAGDWDRLVVDEAHHLAWSPEAVSPEYRCIEALASRIPGVLLLTATPEQLGVASHFARLRLLDPDRFPDLERFQAEAAAYAPVAQAVEALLAERPLTASERQTLLERIQTAEDQRLVDALVHARADPADRNALVEHLLDRHGTGRVLFRNTRAAVAGFPDRQLIAWPLPLPDAYRPLLTAAAAAERRLRPERLYAEAAQAAWTRIDPRVNWLVARLAEWRPAKVLLITASAQTAVELAEALRLATGTRPALFHEGMTLLERDRAAAYFAEPDSGSQLLICSEIGSEGRNFQFAHHLVLFDLPLNPDRLEQRIGRLDRIGQQETVRIHVPYLEQSAQARLFHWYHEGLGAFEHTCPTGHSVYEQVAADLHALLEGDEDPAAEAQLIAATRQLNGALTEALHQGRDRLLEYNSCRPGVADALCRQAVTEERSTELLDYLDALFDALGIDWEPHSPGAFVMHPGTQMQNALPGLPEDGLTFTCDRDTALANESLQFLTWEHPLVQAAMEQVLTAERGNAVVAALPYQGARAGTLLLECLFALEVASSATVPAARFLPATTLRVVIDERGQDHAAALDVERIGGEADALDAETAGRVVQACRERLRDLLAAGERLAEQQVPELLVRARAEAAMVLDREIERLTALQKDNPHVRDEEVAFFRRQRRAVSRALAAAHLRLDAIRVLVVTG